ncbi:MAG: NAD(P)-binding domain-containing protein, partial [Acidobacteria bacterium]|nr:NAD(P)-binding domain-containing protein [Acidobacteriota bacterium]
MRWHSQSGSIWDMGPSFPVLDANRQSSIPGLYLAGDVTGTPDIKAAINTGAEVARHLLRQEIICKPPCDAHVIIIGGGPAGVSAALEFEKALREGRWPPEAGRRHTSGAPLDKLGVSAPSEAVRPPTSLRKAQSFSDDRDVGAKAPTPPHTGYLLLEKKKLFATIHSFAKCKPLFYASTGAPDVRGGLWWEEIAPGAGIQSCDVLAEWEKQLAGTDLNVRLGEAVTDIQKTDKFRIVTQSDDGGKRSYVCDRVILCIGKLIYLLKLDVGAEAEPKVFYEPPEPGKLRDRDVLVVGGTNEALETALALAAENRVTLACPPRNNATGKRQIGQTGMSAPPSAEATRQEELPVAGATGLGAGGERATAKGCEFPDAEPALVKELEAAMAAGRLNVLAETRVREMTPDAVVLNT